MTGRRKKLDVIEREHAERAAERDRFRPLPSRAVATAREKARLQNAFQFKGGKALPAGVLPEPVRGHIPLTMQAGRVKRRRSSGGSDGALSEDERRRRRRAARGLPPERGSVDEMRALFDATMAEIEERKAFMDAMEASGDGDRHVMRIEAEIRDRLRDLDRLDKLIREASRSEGGV
eukprot:PLAT11542.2.p2 GENE.PLAT11542.2~~PLAT11542.2.p2  ORF type:complete len:177 (+),score=58.04 PLAT11542.2:291-821(+)